MLCFYIDKIYKQKWKEMDSWVYNKIISFIKPRQKQASNNQEQNCFNFMGTSQIFTHVSWWIQVCLFISYVTILLIPTNPTMHSLWCYILTFDLAQKMLFQGDTPEGSDAFQWPVIERDRVGGLRLMIWDKMKVPLCHYSDAPEESDLWTAWQLFPLDDD